MGLEELEGRRRRLKKKEVNELLADKGWKEDRMLTKFFGGGKTYVHPENNFVLAVDWNGRRGTLLLDKDVVYRVASDPDTLRPRHMLQGIFPYGSDFPERSKPLAEKFLGNMRAEINRPIDPNSRASLDAVDRFVAKKGARAFLRPDSFAELLAYVGNVLRREYSLEWSMVRVSEELWEPWLVDGHGNRSAIFAAVYKELYEYAPWRSSIYGVVIGEVES